MAVDSPPPRRRPARLRRAIPKRPVASRPPAAGGAFAPAPEEAARGRHRFAVGLAAAVVVLISAGALVTSKQAGLAVPDWPLSYGSLNPPRWWQIENVRAEHGHRLIAGAVALATLVLAVWTSRRERRPWVRRLAWLAVAAVLAQALLGGLTVLLLLPPAVSVAHAAVAQLFLGLVTALALATSRRWRRPAEPPPAPPARQAALAAAATATTGLVYLQILVGAVMRHTGAGLAIPDFPLAFGRLVPPAMPFPVAIHYAHRLGAVAVALAAAWTLIRVIRCCPRRREILLPAVILAGLVLLQVGLGASVVLSRKAVVPNTVHVATGAVLLATSLVLTLQARRPWVAWRREALGASAAGGRGNDGRRAGAAHPAASTELS